MDVVYRTTRINNLFIYLFIYLFIFFFAFQAGTFNYKKHNMTSLFNLIFSIYVTPDMAEMKQRSYIVIGKKQYATMQIFSKELDLEDYCLSI